MLLQYLRQGLQIAEQLGRREDEAKIRHRLGLALWADNDLEESQHQLYKAAELFENIRREAHVCSDYKLSLFDLQTASYQALQVCRQDPLACIRACLIPQCTFMEFSSYSITDSI